jgi:CDP-diacylglycerol--serine O-phosphatidyltransferase
MIRLLSIADAISITNAIFGILAILFLFSNLGTCVEFRVRASFSFIFFALLADGLDGIVARKTRKSDLGEYLESMADMTSLVIAPAAFIYFIYSDSVACCIYRHVYLLFALILFLSFGIIRLASFHLIKKDKYFIGLPASASTIILLIISWFEVEFIYILPAVVIIGAVMASDINFPKPGIKINAIASILIILTLIIYKGYYGIAPLLLLTAILVYSIGGPIYIKFLEKGR